MSLTPNGIRTLWGMSQSQDNPAFSPTIQIIHLKRIENKGGAATGGEERWKLILSDGTYFCHGMCATQLNHRIHDGVISQNAVLTVNEFIVNTMGSGQKICIVLNVDPAGPNPGERIRAPTDIAKANLPPMGGGGGGGGGMYGNQNVPPSAAGGGGNPYGRPSPGGIKSNPYGGGGDGGGGGGYRPNNNAVSSAPVVRTSASGQPITPISGLNMYSNRWVLQAKVTSKSPVRNWSNAKGEGSLFSAELLDASGTDVRCTFFKEAVDKFHNFLEQGKVYTFSGGRLKVANMQYNTCKSQFEITFDQNAEIHLDQSAGDDIVQSYEFVKVAALEKIEPSGFVDILSVVKHIDEPTTILSKKTGKELLKCELTLEDDSGAEVRLTVWGEDATNASTTFAGAPVVAFKRVRVSDFGGRSLSGGTYSVNPKIPETGALQRWWASNGAKSQARSLSSGVGGNRAPDPFERRKSISDIKADELGSNEGKPDWISFKATFTFLKKEKSGGEGAWYTACAKEGDPCKNMYKATQTSAGDWHCEKCQETFQSCVRRFIFSGTVADDSCTTWVSVFNEQAEIMFNDVKADYLFEQLETGNGQDLYDSTFMKASYTEWIMKCKVKREMVNDESRIKTSVVSMNPVDYADESRNLLTALGA